MSDLNKKYLNRIDFYNVVDLAAHCDVRKLNIAINTAVNIDLQKILCELFSFTFKVLEKEDRTELENKIVNGGSYKCGNNEKFFLGTKQIVIYYSYANYLANSYANDTGLGFKQKTDSYSLPVPKKEVDSFSIQNRNIGYEIIKQYKDFLCHHATELKDYELVLKDCDCGCGCSGSNCKDGVETRRITSVPRIIKKR